MGDRYLNFVNSPAGKAMATWLGLPSPVPLVRGTDPLTGKVLVAPETAVSQDGAILRWLADARMTVLTPASADQETMEAILIDARGIADAADLRWLFDVLQPALGRLQPHGRVLVLGRSAGNCKVPAIAAAQRALEGLVRSLSKELGRKGTTTNLLALNEEADSGAVAAIDFFLSRRSAFVTGQVLGVSSGPAPLPSPRSLAGKTAVVTGASRGIGADIATCLAREGANVIGMDLPAMAESLQALMSSLNGRAVTLDITAADAPQRWCDIAREYSGLDVVVHNAGVTRDKTLARMPAHFWDQVIAVNLLAEEHINSALLEAGLIRPEGRLIGISSISGIAGNFGQTNYAAAKCGVIGYVEALAPLLRDQITINAIAPGFIETAMTASIPLMTREAGRRLNSLSQGGLPIDVAEAVTFLATPAARGINGQILRVCGQNLLGK